MNIDEIKKSVSDNLKEFDSMQSKYKLYSVNAVNLLLGTIAQESNFKHVKQLGNGPARSYYQIEPATAIDVIINNIEYNQTLKLILSNISSITTYRIKGFDPKSPNKYMIEYIGNELLNNFKFATLIARLCYYRRSFNFTDGSVDELAEIWKIYYNTYYGKGTVEEFKNNYRIYVDRKTF